MSRPAKSLSDIWDIYLNYRMAPLPGASAFMSAISPQGEILDVQDFFKKEFDQIINQVKADAWDGALELLENNSEIDLDDLEHYKEICPYRKQEEV